MHQGSLVATGAVLQATAPAHAHAGRFALVAFAAAGLFMLSCIPAIVAHARFRRLWDMAHGDSADWAGDRSRFFLEGNWAEQRRRGAEFWKQQPDPAVEQARQRALSWMGVAGATALVLFIGVVFLGSAVSR